MAPPELASCFLIVLSPAVLSRGLALSSLSGVVLSAFILVEIELKIMQK